MMDPEIAYANFSEHQEQCALIDLFRTLYPDLRHRLFAIPNGGLRNIKVAQKLKKEGVARGVADLFLMVAKGGYHGLFIEMKQRKSGQQSKNQKEFEAEAIKAGYCYFLAHGFDEAIGFIKRYLGGDILNVQ